MLGFWAGRHILQSPDQHSLFITVYITVFHNNKYKHNNSPLNTDITSPNMRASSILAASASLLSLAQARIYGVGVPSTVKAGDTFDLIVKAQNYIQAVTDVSIAVGYSAGNYPASESLGTLITAFDLGKSGPSWRSGIACCP